MWESLFRIQWVKSVCFAQDTNGSDRVKRKTNKNGEIVSYVGEFHKKRMGIISEDS